jgi:hypothetical protein
MKKVILAMVFIFATGTMMKASSSKEEITTPITRTLEKANDCFEDAWEFGTEEGGEMRLKNGKE